ncbi:MAG TPA: hypothetical protein VG734_20750 [Lacunisphaera sp.]|nr:hypothetical protein [Lacunisphaera sp.]
MTRSHDIVRHWKARPLSAAAEGVDHADPAVALMEAEERELTPPAPDRSDVAGMLMAHLFGDGPHPERVTLRLYRLAEAMGCDLLQALPYSERSLLVADDEAAREHRLAALLRGTRIARRKPATHEAAIRTVLKAAWDRQRQLFMAREVPAAALIDYQAASPDELLGQFQARQAAVVALLEFFFRDGAAPEQAVKRVFMVAKAYFEPLVLRMSLQKLGGMFGQTRATWSWRGKNKLNGFLAARGISAVKAPYQKSDDVCVKYALAAAGNRNRATGRRVA